MLTNNEITDVNTALNKKQTLLAAESCIDKSIQWLKTNYANNDICSKKIYGSDLDFGAYKTNYRTLKYSNSPITYNCEILCSNEATKNGFGLGVQIDMDNGYGRPRQIGSGSLASGSYYYKIKAIGSGPLSQLSTIEAIISVNY